MGFLDSTANKMRRRIDDVEKRVRRDLKGKSDEEIRKIIYHGTNNEGRRLAREEADRRGISY